MSPRGGDRGGRRPLKDPGDPRVPFACRIKSSNKDWLEAEKERTGLGIGELNDLAIETLKEKPEALKDKLDE